MAGMWWLIACRGTPAPIAAELVVLADVGVVVTEGVVTAVHADPDAARGAIGDATVVVKGQRVTAGFVDAHAHPVGLGQSLDQLDLVGISSYAETLAAVARVAPGTGWLQGRGWDQNDWPDPPEGIWPRAEDLDAIVGDRPTMLRRVDGHAAWLSSAAMAATGIDATTPDPEGGTLVRDPSGRPTGVLIDNAMDAVTPPPPTDADRIRWAEAGMARFADLGFTGVHVMGIDDPTLGVLGDLAMADTLPIRLWIYVDPDSAAVGRLSTSGPYDVGSMRVVGVKAYADGALGSRGALLSEDYSDAPGQRGLSVTSAEALQGLAEGLTAGGSQLAVHAIGDAGVRRALDAFAAAGPGHRVEHAQVVHPDDVGRFAALSVTASMQPTHAVSDGPWAPDRLGPDRTPWSYAWRTLIEAGAPLALGSDAPVEDPSPARGMAAATTRGGWRLDEALTEAEAVAGFTSGAAAAVGEDALGHLRAGATADLTVWADGWVPVATVVAGRVRRPIP